MLEVVARHTSLPGMTATAVTTLYLAERMTGEICLIGFDMCQEGFWQALQAMNAAETSEDQRLVNWIVT
ncbi:hypothetical protein BGP84_12665 [Pseudomonas putida]|uniref:Uncharacterized protein n=1 Tax=Pseudomonas putida TaxID=303 RepID=A0A2S3X4M8_PSEPU|nr:hypothetical protein [Pseudomonas putida]POG10532.1 hypothetical protein BGP84_12665 [Pseudomonas putida]POG16678.1 hypothetical protein BGP85_11170 [Pseudomonas putida]